MNAKRAFVVGAIVGPAIVSSLGWIIDGTETESSQAKEPPQPALNSVMEPEPNPLQMSSIHQAKLPKRSLLTDLRNESIDAQKIRIIKVIGQSRLKDAAPDLGEIAETERGAIRRAAIDALGMVGGTHATDVLIGLSESNQKDVRHQALQALGRWDSPNAIDWLKEVAESNLLRMGHSALQSMAQSGDDSYLSYFVEIMNHRNIRVASGAAEALATLGTNRSRQTLLLMARREAPSAVRLAAIRGLSAFDDPEVKRLVGKLIFNERVQVAKAAIESYAKMNSEGVVQTLADIAQTGRRALQETATAGLETVGSVEARDELINILFTEEAHTIFAAANALANMGDAESLRALTDGLNGGMNITMAVLHAIENVPADDALLRAVSDILASNKNQMSEKAAKVLAIHLGADAIPHIIKGLKKVRDHHHDRLCKVLASIDSEAGTKALLEIVRTDMGRTNNKSQGLNALAALVQYERLTPAVARELTIEQLNRTKDSVSTKRLVRILATLGDPEADQHLLTLLKSCPPLKIQAILSGIDSEGGADLLAKVIVHIRKMPTGRRRQSMIETLGINRPDSREFLRDIAAGKGKEAAAALAGFAWQAPHEVRDIAFNAIQSDDPAMRRSALTVLQNINGTEEINAFAGLINDKDPSVRVLAISALSNNRDPYATELLVNAFEEGDDSLRAASAYHIASSGHPRALDVLVDATLSSGENSSSFFYVIEQMATPESKQALKIIKEQAPKDNVNLQADILDSELAKEEQSLFKALGGQHAFDSKVRIYHFD